MRVVVSTLRTYPHGMDKPHTDIPNLRVITTGLATDVGGTRNDYYVGIGHFSMHDKPFWVCKPATADHIDYWYRRETFERQVLLEHTGMPKGWHGRTV